MQRSREANGISIYGCVIRTDEPQNGEILKKINMISQITKYSRAYEVCFYWEDENGIETIEGLYSWEMKDNANRRLIKVSSKKEAESAKAKDYL